VRQASNSSIEVHGGGSYLSQTICASLWPRHGEKNGIRRDSLAEWHGRNAPERAADCIYTVVEGAGSGIQKLSGAVAPRASGRFIDFRGDMHFALTRDSPRTLTDTMSPASYPFPGFCLPLNGRHICIAAVLRWRCRLSPPRLQPILRRIPAAPV